MSIKIELFPDEFIFSHNGDYFNIENLFGLTIQISSKNSTNSNGQVGKFGSGFITTQILSDIITISGIVKYKEIFKKFELVLDRSASNSEELSKSIESAVNKIRKIENQDSEDFQVIESYNKTKDDFDTSFKYKLVSDNKRKIAKEGVNDLINTLPATLAIQSDKINSVEIIDKIQGKNQKYECIIKKLEQNIYLAEIKINLTEKTYSVFYLVYKDKEINLLIEIKSEEDFCLLKKKENQPVLYIDFPLIGTENFHFPFVINSLNFNPVESRDEIVINGDKECDDAEQNRKLLNDAIEYSFPFIDYLIRKNSRNRYLLASSEIPHLKTNFSNYAKNWFMNKQKCWRNILQDKNLLCGKDGSYHELKKICLPLFNDFCEDEFYDLVSFMNIGEKILPCKEEYKYWAEIITKQKETWPDNWIYNEIQFIEDISHKKNIGDLSLFLGQTDEKTFEWLNKIYDKDKIFLVEKKPIIPNQKGEFKVLQELYSDRQNRIPCYIKSCINDIHEENGYIEKILINENIHDKVFENMIKKKDFNDISIELNNYISDNNQSPSNIKEKLVYDLLVFFPKDDNELENIYYFINNLKGRERISFNNKIYYPRNLWDKAKKYFYEDSPNIIAKNENTEMLKKNLKNFGNEENILEWINSFIKLVKKNNYKLDSIKLFPSQKGELKILKDLKFDQNVPEIYKDVYLIVEKNKRSELLSSSIQGYENHNPWKIVDAYNEIQLILKKEKIDEKKGIEISKVLLSINPINENDTDLKNRNSKLHELLNLFFKESSKVIQANTNGFGFDFVYIYVINYFAKVFDSFSKKENDKNELKLTNEEFIQFNLKFSIDILTIFQNNKNIIENLIRTDYNTLCNQNNKICNISQLYIDKIDEDENIKERILELANNIHIKGEQYKDIRDSMIHKGLAPVYEKIKYFFPKIKEITIKTILSKIDEKIKNYNSDKQNKDFSSLIFGLQKLLSTKKEFFEFMPYFSANVSKLIVGSMGDDEKIEKIGEIITSCSDELEKLKLLSKIAKDANLDDMTQLINKINNRKNTNQNVISYEISFVKNIESKYNETKISIGTYFDQEHFNRETGRIGERYVFNYLKNKEDLTDVKWENDEIESGKPYDIFATVKNTKKSVYFEVKSSIKGIRSSIEIFKISENQMNFAERIIKDQEYYIVQVTNTRNSPELMFCKLSEDIYENKNLKLKEK